MAVYRINKELIQKAKQLDSSLSFVAIDNILPIIENAVGFGRLTVIGSRPGIGKTSFILNVVVEMLKKGKRVVLVSLELSAIQIVNRLLLLFDNAYHKFLSGFVTL